MSRLRLTLEQIAAWELEAALQHGDSLETKRTLYRWRLFRLRREEMRIPWGYCTGPNCCDLCPKTAKNYTTTNQKRDWVQRLRPRAGVVICGDCALELRWKHNAMPEGEKVWV